MFYLSLQYLLFIPTDCEIIKAKEVILNLAEFMIQDRS